MTYISLKLPTYVKCTGLLHCAPLKFINIEFTLLTSIILYKNMKVNF